MGLAGVGSTSVGSTVAGSTSVHSYQRGQQPPSLPNYTHQHPQTLLRAFPKDHCTQLHQVTQK